MGYCYVGINCYIAIMASFGHPNCSSQENFMASGKFDGEGFFAAIDSVRIARDLNWKKVAEQAEVPASTLTRMSQGRKPDVDSLASLCAWSGLKVEDFTHGTTKKKVPAEPLAELTAHLRADPKLSKEGARALEALIKTAYQQFRKS
jgi:transcriptional regulator with XRE-family HTH domain